MPESNSTDREYRYVYKKIENAPFFLGVTNTQTAICEQRRSIKTNILSAADVQTTMAEDREEVLFPVTCARLLRVEVNIPLSDIKPKWKPSLKTNLKGRQKVV